MLSYVLNVSISPVRLILSTRTLSTFSFSFSSSWKDKRNAQISTPNPYFWVNLLGSSD